VDVLVIGLIDVDGLAIDAGVAVGHARNRSADSDQGGPVPSSVSPSAPRFQRGWRGTLGWQVAWRQHRA
jgi:hypothetical protein